MLLSEIKDHFESRAKKYDSSAHWVKDEKLLNFVKNLSGISLKDYVLDVACGTGVISELFFKKTKRVIGLDATELMYKQAFSKLDFLINADAEAMPFKNNQFDLVICRQGLQFMQAQSAIKEMYRVCKPKGKIMLIQLTAFGKEDKEYAFKIQMARQPVRRNCFLEEDLINLLKKAGCININSYPYFSYESVNDWIDNGALNQERQIQIKKLYEEAPEVYKRLHEVKFSGNDIIDKMKIAIVLGYK